MKSIDMRHESGKKDGRPPGLPRRAPILTFLNEKITRQHLDANITITDEKKGITRSRIIVSLNPSMRSAILFLSQRRIPAEYSTCLSLELDEDIHSAAPDLPA